jgi:hypothetical protein
VDNPRPAPSIDEVVALSQIPYPNRPPYTHIAFCVVAWNESGRLGRLLARVRPYFAHLIVGVQQSDDDTLLHAERWADDVVEDKHHGFGDATFGPKLLPRVAEPWVVKVDADEWPSDDLLDSLSNATWYAENVAHTRGVWLPFRSSVDGVEYEEQHAHLRLFHAAAGWPPLLHSRPPIEDGILWQTGHIRHDRTLDELVQDYLRYLEKGKGNAGWTAHNKMMIRSACEGTATVKGWDYVRAFPWWSQAQKAFGLDKPWETK